MNAKHLKTIRAQLDATLQKFSPMRDITPPPKGWLRAVRDALGMNGRQFAARLGVSPSRVSKLESDEVAGAVSLNTLKKAAEALDCELVYSLVPKSSLKETAHKQAVKIASQRFKRTSHTMALEDQSLDKNSQRQALEELIEELSLSQPKNFWDNP
ncbi:MAG: mobile mystery protein A [Desulfobulbaceae bacterium]|nr:mobile mystery protein A [Desulfobulbaceae bacterium]